MGLRYCGNSVGFYRELSRKFLELMPRKEAQIENAYQTENWNDYVAYVHALKSSSLSLGGKRLSEAAKRSEAFGKILLADNADAAEKEKSLAEIRETHEALLALYDELGERLREETKNL